MMKCVFDLVFDKLTKMSKPIGINILFMKKKVFKLPEKLC